MINHAATDRTKRLAAICKQLANRGDGIVSLLGKDDLYWLLGEVNRLHTMLADAQARVDRLRKTHRHKDRRIMRLSDVLREIGQLDLEDDEGYGLIAELARAALNEEAGE